MSSSGVVRHMRCKLDNYDPGMSIRAVQDFSQSPSEGPFPFLVTLLRRLGIPECDWAYVEDLGSVYIEHMILSCLVITIWEEEEDSGTSIAEGSVRGTIGVGNYKVILREYFYRFHISI
ncbi:hypothetical protein TNCV_1877501 [Trichonephila clavipes]|nr:hypothetical protein TNCV_1877501 [Trichonephila clavipes]